MLMLKPDIALPRYGYFIDVITEWWKAYFEKRLLKFPGDLGKVLVYTSKFILVENNVFPKILQATRE